LSTFVSAFIVAFAVQWKLTLITLGIVPAIVIAVGICIGFVTKYESKQLDIYSRAGLLAEEVFSTVRTVHAFWLNPLLSRKFDKLIDEALVVGMKNSPVFAVLFSTEFFCVYSGYGLAFWQGIRLYFNGTIREAGDV
jgi:ATP-binding cassette subfamily B (MDR/TAP) protein 1